MRLKLFHLFALLAIICLNSSKSHAVPVSPAPTPELGGGGWEDDERGCCKATLHFGYCNYNKTAKKNHCIHPIPDTREACADVVVKYGCNNESMSLQAIFPEGNCPQDKKYVDDPKSNDRKACKWVTIDSPNPDPNATCMDFQDPTPIGGIYTRYHCVSREEATPMPTIKDGY